jgi:hypothetical protein
MAGGSANATTGRGADTASRIPWPIRHRGSRGRYGTDVTVADTASMIRRADTALMIRRADTASMIRRADTAKLIRRADTAK